MSITAVLLFDDVAACGEVGDDAVGAAFGDAHAGGDVAQSHAGVVSDAQQYQGRDWSGKFQVAMAR